MDVQALGKAMKLDDQVTFKVKHHKPKKRHLFYFCFYLFLAELTEECHFREEFVQRKNVMMKKQMPML